uniref:Uncharacterized protein n=1 Tax=virus sp. ctkyY8 TaxID=2827995 RepID=A0A8S5REK8_9VIRU|nr:MAG TPA: hypothetical protein [virus sp. ctkyY8]
MAFSLGAVVRILGDYQWGENCSEIIYIGDFPQHPIQYHLGRAKCETLEFYIFQKKFLPHPDIQ